MIVSTENKITHETNERGPDDETMEPQIELSWEERMRATHRWTRIVYHLAKENSISGLLILRTARPSSSSVPIQSVPSSRRETPQKLAHSKEPERTIMMARIYRDCHHTISDQ